MILLLFQSISGCINGRFVSYFQKSWPHLFGQEKVKLFSLFFFPLFTDIFLYKVNSFVTWLIKYVKVRTTIFSSILSSPSLWWCLKAPGWQRHWRQLRWEFWQRESCLRPVGLSSFSFSSLYYFMAHSARFWARCKTCSSPNMHAMRENLHSLYRRTTTSPISFSLLPNL